MTPEVIGTLSARFRIGPVTACVPITLGLMNENWRWDTPSGSWAVKKLRDATPDAVRRQQRVLPILAAHGLPVAVPAGLTELAGHWYTIAPWLPGTHPNGPGLSLPACHHLGRTVGEIHTYLRDALPAGRPTLPEPPTAAAAMAELTRLTGDFAATEIAWRITLLRTIAHLGPPPGRDENPIGWTHGDLTDLNLLVTGERVTGILDWDRLGIRPLGREVVRTAAIVFDTGDGLDLPRVAAFAAGYRTRVDISDTALRDAAHRRWWDYATDTYFLRRHYDHGDTACDHLFHRSTALLRWWTDHRADVDAALTTS